MSNFFLSEEDIAVLKKVILENSHTISGIDVGTGNQTSTVNLPMHPHYCNEYMCLLVQNGGSQGSATAAATYSYDIYNIWDAGLTNKLNSTALVPLKPLPFCEVTQQPSSTANGTKSYCSVFWDGSQWQIWDSGAVPTTCLTAVTCS